MTVRTGFLLLATLIMVPSTGSAQWTNRYPMVRGHSHHVYLEGYELPALTAGPIDPAPSPDGTELAFSSRGWLWILDLATGEARRITNGGDLDFRPAWSPDGTRIAFVRDNSSNTSIVVLDLASGSEETIVDTPALDLDPAFASSTLLYYASAEAGDIDVWSVDLATREKTRVTNHPGLELKPQPHPDGTGLLYLSKRPDEIRFLGPGGEQTITGGSILSMTRPALSPDGSMVVANWPTQDGWELRVLNPNDPDPFVHLATGSALPLTPAWSADGGSVYFSEPDDRQRMKLKQVRRGGGPVSDVRVSWNWGVPTARLRIQTRLAGESGFTPARLEILDRKGHPAIPDETASHFDGQSGRVFVYSSGVLEVEIPAGEYTVSGVHGLTTPEAVVTGTVARGETQVVTLELAPVWNARAAGWTSGDHHFHLNYGGQYDLAPVDLVLPMQGENLDMATPLLANLHNRFHDQEMFGWQKTGDVPLIWFGQEIRAHFLGHLNLIGIRDLFWPWVWGPGYQVYGTDDRTNSEPLQYARSQGGVGGYVHPIMNQDVFASGQFRGVPVEMVVDAVLGDIDIFELACLWSNDFGTMEMWYRFLNLGMPVAPSAGTDIMLNFYRTMAVGTTRVYAYTGDDVNWSAYLTALKAGRSFVTNGPMIEFLVDDMGPGKVVGSGGRSVSWSLNLHSAGPAEHVEIVVNGEVVWSGRGISESGSRRLTGTVDVPAGGWVAARVAGGEIRWPVMASDVFAHTGPVWIGSVGSVDASAQQKAAADLMRVLDASETRLGEGYGDAETPKLLERFGEARERLENLVEPNPSSPRE